ncbi:hypothetical protein Cgig2_010263 [Carnegiea gigantea]|uniref:DNA-directed DNA polymerase n=1 Tax=Carnegiea gigantea TaxID=171969 RepID=A0A9Q1KE67_9CARY|nr:hypothetical protein Cgig2_010263 [Carnegiea gigantea]
MKEDKVDALSPQNLATRRKAFLEESGFDKLSSIRYPSLRWCDVEGPRDYLRKNYFDDEAFHIHLPTRNQDNFIRHGYNGDHANVYKPYGENLYYYDVNSLYPYIMNAYPMAYELKFARNLGYHIIPLRQYLFEKKDSPFKDFISHLSKSRLESKKSGDEAMSYFHKILMNSLYGRFGINPESTVTEICNQKKYEELMKMDNFQCAEKLTDHTRLREVIDLVSKDATTIYISKLLREKAKNPMITNKSTKQEEVSQSPMEGQKTKPTLYNTKAATKKGRTDEDVVDELDLTRLTEEPTLASMNILRLAENFVDTKCPIQYHDACVGVKTV